MKIYIMLPLVNERYYDSGLTETAGLTDDYAEQFKTETAFCYIPSGIIGKRSEYSKQYSNHWAYTMMQPETFKLC